MIQASYGIISSSFYVNTIPYIWSFQNKVRFDLENRTAINVSYIKRTVDILIVELFTEAYTIRIHNP